MTTLNKKKVRRNITSFREFTDDELRERYQDTMTLEEKAALERIFNERGMMPPPAHGEIIATANESQRVISLEELGTVNVQSEKRKLGMGSLEWLSVIVGTLVTMLLWKADTMTAVGIGLAIALLVYIAGIVLRRAGEIVQEHQKKS